MARAPMNGGEIAALIDHTLLRPDATKQDIETLCEEAMRFRFATVCVNPVWVSLAARCLAGSGVRVCSVAGFPLGATKPEVKAFETGHLIADGAREVDMVIDIGALKSGNLEAVERDISSVMRVCREGGALGKAIIEASLLTDPEKVSACSLAEAAGAAYVKTSTGVGAGGATVADVALMRRSVGAQVGVKAAGGIRTLATLTAMVAAGASRIGTSAGVRIVEEVERATGIEPV